MTLSDEERQALRDCWYSYGGTILRRMLSEQAQEPKDELWAIMASKPDTLTGKSALKLAMRSKALHQFAESVQDEVKLLNPHPQGQGQGQ